MKLRRFAILTALIFCAAAARADDLASQVSRAAADLKTTRKVSLKTVPPVAAVSKERYVEEYVIPELDAAWGGDFAKSLELFKALGMVPRDLDAKAFLRQYGATMSAAAYDFLKKRILFPTDTVAPDVLLHEMVHASQDERFDIGARMLACRGDLDRTLAMGAVFEGEALNVQLRYQAGPGRTLAGLTPYGDLRDEARAYFERLNRGCEQWLSGVPPAVLRAQAFVYEEGVLFVERLRRRERDWAAVDAAYKMPPRSTAQILHPEKYLAGEWPVEMTIENKEALLRGAGCALAAENTLGEFGIRLFLMSHGSDVDAAAKAASGWRGDRVFLYRSDRHKSDSLVWVSAWESPERARKAGEALRAALGKAAIIVRDADVTLLSGNGIPAVLDVKIIRKPSTEGRPLGGQDEGR